MTPRHGRAAVPLSLFGAGAPAVLIGLPPNCQLHRAVSRIGATTSKTAPSCPQIVFTRSDGKSAFPEVVDMQGSSQWCRLGRWAIYEQACTGHMSRTGDHRTPPVLLTSSAEPTCQVRTRSQLSATVVLV